MMNSQILANTPVSPGQNAQTMQSKLSGSDPTRIKETSQDTPDTMAPGTVTSTEPQNGQDEAPENPKDFKQTLTEKMAPKTSEETPEEPVIESSDPEAATLQPAVSPTQLAVQSAVLPSVNQGEPTSQIADVLTADSPETAKSDRGLANLVQNQGPDRPDQLTATAEAPSDIPVATVVEKNAETNALTPQTAAVIPLQTHEDVSPQNVAPTGQTMPAQPEEVPVAAQGQMKQPDPKAVHPEYIASQAKPTETAQPQPELQAQRTPAPAQPEAVAPSEPALAIQSIQQKTDKGNEGNIEPLIASPVQQKTSAEAPEPTQVTRPSQQAVTTQLEPPQEEIPAAKTQAVTTQLEPSQEKIPAAKANDAPEPIQVTQPVQQAVTAQLEPSQEHIPVAQTNDASESQPPLAAMPPTPVLSPSETQTTTDTPLPRPLDLASTSVARQIQDSIAEGIQANGRQIVIRMDPPELGRVAMRFLENDQSITGVLEVQRSQTRHDIQQALPEIIQQLQDSGVQVKRIEVLLSSDADPETFEDQAFAQAHDQNQNLEHEQASEQNKATRNPSYPWSSSANQGSFRSAEDQYASDQGINMLI